MYRRDCYIFNGSVWQVAPPMTYGRYSFTMQEYDGYFPGLFLTFNSSFEDLLYALGGTELIYSASHKLYRDFVRPFTHRKRDECT